MANPARSGELIGQKLGKYELLALIAVGGTAEIYLARISGASGFEKYLVVKCLLDHLADDQEFVRMFLDEARVGAQLDHSNIVQTLELGEQDGRYFLVIEYLAGMSVAQMARKTQERNVNGGLIDTNIVLGMASQTCNGLHYAHRKTVQGKALNLVHRDISPQNLVVSYEGILKIVDFGIAKSDIREAQTRTGTIKGKFAYMSPEQCLAKKIDNRTDIFALGTLCHELLTGRRLFKRQTTYDTYQAIVNGVVPKPSQVNPKLDAGVDNVIMKALAYDPDERYPNAQAFGEALLGLLHKRSGSGGAGEISQFFETHFHEDLAAHAEQMREFITGKKPVPKEPSWDQELAEGEASARRKTAPVDAPPKPHASIPLIKPVQAPAHLDSEYDDDDDDDEGPTRIEFDPGAQLDELTTPTSEVDVDEGWDAEGPTAIGSIDNTPPKPPQNVNPAMNVELPPVPSTNLNQAGGAAPKDFATPPATINVSELPAHLQPQAPAKSSEHLPRAQTRPPMATPAPSPTPQQPAYAQQQPAQQQQPGQAYAQQQQQAYAQQQQQAYAQQQQQAYAQQQQQPGQQQQQPGQQQQSADIGIAATIASLDGPGAGHGGQQPVPGSVPVDLAGSEAQPLYPAYVGGALPIAAQGSGAVVNNPGAYPADVPRQSAQMTASLPQYPATSLVGEKQPVAAWMHAAIFLAFVGLGIGVAAFFKMLL